MPFRMYTRVGSVNHVLDGGRDPSMYHHVSDTPWAMNTSSLCASRRTQQIFVQQEEAMRPHASITVATC